MRATFSTIGVAVAAALLLTLHATGAVPKFLPDDPIQVETDSQNAAGVKAWDIDLVTDLTLSMFGKPGDPTADVRAKSVNTVDEVPDSSWFTNRAGRGPLTAGEVFRGPDTTPGPAAGTWTVTSSKSNGVTPGFTIRDANDQVWFLKFDAPGYRGMATGTEVTVTKLLWALGYHVPENHIAYFRPEQLAVGDGARFTPPGGVRRPMQRSDIDALLKRVDREPDGTYRVVASLGIRNVLGGFRFYGTRPDDPNDVIPHEHRRELRGYGVFSAWLNHVDAKAINSMDALVTDAPRSYVRHYLLDFGSTLGSASLQPREHWEGSEYLFDPQETMRQIIGFGFVFPDWHTRRFYEAPSIGRLPIDNRSFDPDRWKPRVPNPAFVRARADDKFWAAQKLMALTDDLIGAAVRAGDFGDPESEAFLVRALGERRDAIVRKYLAAINPISEPQLDNQGLRFRNAAVDARAAGNPQSYHASWFAFDNATGTARALGETSGAAPSLSAPDGLGAGAGAFIKIELSARGEQPAWAKPVHAYFARETTGWRLVGFERMPND